MSVPPRTAAPGPRRGAAGRLLANLALAAVSLVVFLVGLEALCRVAGFQSRGSWSARCYERVPPIGHLFVPGCESAMYKGISSAWREIPVRINAHGLRGPEFPTAKPAGVSRVLVLGDSFAFGYLLPEEDSLAPQLEDRLTAARGPGRAQVINAGVPGYGIRNERLFLAHRGLAFAPDAVVLVASPGDIADSGVRLDQADAGGRVNMGRELRLYRAVQSSALANFMQYLLFLGLNRANPTLHLRGRLNAESPSPGVREAWDRYAREFARVAALARDGGIPLLLVVYPGEMELFADRNTVERRWRALAAEHDVPMVALLDVFKRERTRGLYLPADGHPTATANGLVADAVAAWLVPRLGT